jgi:hypothetical protein
MEHTFSCPFDSLTLKSAMNAKFGPLPSELGMN